MIPAATPDILSVAWLGRRSYGPTWELQRRLAQLRAASQVGNLLLLVEHPPTYTLGRHGSIDHLIWDETVREREGVEFFQVDRGGDITYHGPGQLVGYPILHLGELGIGVRAYVRGLETALIEVCRRYGISAEVREGFPGVWVHNRKIAAIGIRVARRVTMHGFALNVANDLRYFDGIVPCGILGRGVTSLAEELGSPPNETEVRIRAAEEVSQQLGFSRWAWIDRKAIETLKVPTGS